MATVVPIPTDRRRLVPSDIRRRLAAEVYTVAQVAQLLGLNLGGTYELVRDGTIPARKLGARWVIPKERFHAWLNGIETDDGSANGSATEHRGRKEVLR